MANESGDTYTDHPFPHEGDANVRLVGDVNQNQENNPDLTWEDVRKDILSRLKLEVEMVNWFSSYA